MRSPGPALILRSASGFNTTYMRPWFWAALPPTKARTFSTRGILLHDADEFVGLGVHVMERHILVAHDDANHTASILLWEESFGDDDIKPYVNYDHDDGDSENNRL